MDPILIPIIAVASAPVIAIGLPIARAIARKIEAQAAQPRTPSDVAARLERMEQALDTIAVEIERISEGQRFTTKLLAERGGNQLGSAPDGAGARPNERPAALARP